MLQAKSYSLLSGDVLADIREGFQILDPKKVLYEVFFNAIEQAEFFYGYELVR